MKNLRLKKKFISQESIDQLGGFAQEAGYQNQLKFFIPSSTSVSKDSVNVLIFFLNNNYQSRGKGSDHSRVVAEAAQSVNAYL